MGTRRNFIKKSILTVGGVALGFSARSYNNIIGANDRIHVAFVGCGRRVGAYYASLGPAFNAQLAYICDVKKSQREKVASELSSTLSYKPTLEEDIRKVLADKQVDAIFNATPDHWHAAATWMAMEAGKHVYLEKPATHNPKEGELLIQFQKKYNKVIQVGTQQRSSDHTIEIIREIHNGTIGNPYKALAFYTNQRGRVPNPVKATVPEGLNWELFQGPAPREAYRHDTWDYNWHWYGWKWGTAETGNNATHELDVARWALQVDYPERVSVEASKQHFMDDGWEMYDTMYASFCFTNNKTIHWDGKSRNGQNTYGAGRGTIIYGTEGSVFVDRERYRLYDREGKLIREKTSSGSEAGTTLGGGGDMTDFHIANFYDAIRGKAEVKAPIGEGVKSTLLCHLANISYRTSNVILLDSVNGQSKDPAVNKLWSREYEPGWEAKVMDFKK
jgi:predicted dehydrogenase